MKSPRERLLAAHAELRGAAAARRVELDAHDRVLALLEGDYARATTVLGEEPAGSGVERDWLPGFLLRRELGSGDEDEADLRACMARESDELAQIALVLLLLDIVPSDYAAAAYACTQVIAAGMREAIAHGADAAELREALRSAVVGASERTQTVIGNVGFDASGDSLDQFVTFYSVDPNAAGGKRDWAILDQQNFGPAP